MLATSLRYDKGNDSNNPHHHKSRKERTFTTFDQKQTFSFLLNMKILVFFIMDGPKLE